jgi:hypothetical protein
MAGQGEMKPILQDASEQVAFHMEKIQAVFKPGTKITVVVRPPDHKAEGDTDFIMTDDDIDQAIAALQRRKLRGNEA